MNGLEWLAGLDSRGMRLGLGNITELLRRLGDPQDRPGMVHIAGTDGKGSTAAMISSVLISSGYRTGLYTSPHISKVNERIRIDGTMISDNDLERLADVVREHVDDMTQDGDECTFFEAFTAIAFLYFEENDIDYGVIETGLGGRFDATNVIVPEVSVITHIGLEHVHVLGDTVERIAFEKSGIIKHGVPVVTANTGGAFDTISSVAADRGSRLVAVDTDAIEDVVPDAYGTAMTYRGTGYEIGIPGSFQAENAAVAIETLRTLGNVTDADIGEGLRNAVWEGRMERDGDLILDVTHTADGSAGLARDIRMIYGKTALVLGMLDDKDVDGICRNLAPAATTVYVCAPDTGRAAPASKIAEVMSRYHGDIRRCGSVAEAVETALRERKDGELILVTGSFHMAEEAKRWSRTYAGS